MLRHSTGAPTNNDGTANQLHQAILEGNLAKVQQIIQNLQKLKYVDTYAMLNAQDADGYTPLYYAAAVGCITFVDLLLDAGANPYIQASDGNTPLHRLVDHVFRPVREAELVQVPLDPRTIVSQHPVEGLEYDTLALMERLLWRSNEELTNQREHTFILTLEEAVMRTDNLFQELNAENPQRHFNDEEMDRFNDARLMLNQMSQTYYAQMPKIVEFRELTRDIKYAGHVK